MSDQNPEAWTHFWRQGHITTFATSFSNNYDGTLGDFWQDYFTNLATHSRILDIACGNGAIAALAAQLSMSQTKEFHICASDLAQIQPPANLERALLDTIDFYPETPAQQQPFPSQSFDAIVSNFGFEYSETPATLKEIKRLLVSQGSFVALCHHTESTLIQQAESDAAIYQAALDTHQLFSTLKTVLRGRASGSTAQNKPSAAFNKKMNAFIGAHGKQPSAKEIIQSISHLARSAAGNPLEVQLANVDDAEKEFTFASRRLQHMQKAALSDAAISQLTTNATELGFAIQVQRPLISTAGQTIAWVWQLTAH